MSDKVQTKTKFPTASAFIPQPAELAFRPRPFVLQAKEAEPLALSEVDGLTPNKSLSHNFGAISVHRSNPLVVQPKLTLGPAGDKYEQEADQVAQQVVRQLNAPSSGPGTGQAEPTPVQTSRVAQRLATGEGGAGVTPGVETAIAQARGGGQPLPEQVRGPMERAFGADFSRVRVHTDSRANELNRSLQARAFTIGQDIFLRRSEYSPSNAEGKKLLAHELTHVVQQSGGLGALLQTPIANVVQRNVGFEFEFSDLPVTLTDTNTGLPVQSIGTQTELEKIPPNTTMSVDNYTETGLPVTLTDVSTELRTKTPSTGQEVRSIETLTEATIPPNTIYKDMKGIVEMVTDHFDENAPDAYQRCDNIALGIKEYLEKVKGKLHTGEKEGRKFIINGKGFVPENCFIGPQFTFAIRPERLIEAYKYFVNHTVEGSNPESPGFYEVNFPARHEIKGVINKIDSFVDPAKFENPQLLRGLMIHMAAMIVSTQNESMKKQAATYKWYFPFLHKSSLEYLAAKINPEWFYGGNLAQGAELIADKLHTFTGVGVDVPLLTSEHAKEETAGGDIKKVVKNPDKYTIRNWVHELFINNKDIMADFKDVGKLGPEQRSDIGDPIASSALGDTIKKAPLFEGRFIYGIYQVSHIGPFMKMIVKLVRQWNYGE